MDMEMEQWWAHRGNLSIMHLLYEQGAQNAQENLSTTSERFLVYELVYSFQI